MKTNYNKPNPSSGISNPYLTNNFIARSGQVIDTNNHTQREYAWQVASNLLVSFRYAWAGVRYAFVSQRNFRIHTLITFVAISLGLFLRVAAVEMAIVTLTCALVMVLELINTALESVVDLTVGQSYHDLAKIAKDCAAGAVLIASIAALLVAAFIFLPHLLSANSW
jgi:diacylglycerol kinase (ATP)